MSKLRIMSHNQWNCTNNNPMWEEKNMDCSAKVRMRGHVRVFQELMPDIVGGQEVNMEMQKYLKFYCMEAGLPYTLIWGNFTPLIYRADKLELLDTQYLLYPERVEGYEGCFNDALSKSCNLGVFRSKEDGKVFLFATTHLWWQKGYEPQNPFQAYRAGSDQVRTLQLKLAIDLINTYQKKYDDCPVVLVGDMNTGYYTEAIQYALKEGGFVHAHDVAVEYANPYNGYNFCNKQGPGIWQNLPFEKAIDHILVRNIPEGCVRRFDRYTPDYYLRLSDHAPVFADMEF